jgi:hypothetical protein
MMFFLYVRFIVRFVLLFHVYAHIACVPNMKISQNSFFNFESSIASNIGAQQTTKSDWMYSWTELRIVKDYGGLCVQVLSLLPEN